MTRSKFRPHNRRELPRKQREVVLVSQDLSLKERDMIERFKKDGK